MIPNNSKNIFWINAVKAICIILVYFVHCQLYYGCWMQMVNNFIHPIYVNAFFFISGYLLMRKQLSNNQRISEYVSKNGDGYAFFNNILYKLAIPTMLFSLIEYFPKKIIRGQIIDFHSLLSNTVGGGTYWFTSALVVAEIIVLLMLLTRRKNIWVYFIGGLCVATFAWFLVQSDFHLFGFGRDPWAYRRGMLAVSFLMAGGIYWYYEDIISKCMKSYVIVSLLVLYILIFTFFSKDVPVLISMMDITWVGYLASLLGCAILIELCKKLRESNILTFIGQYSLCFYFLSGALPMIGSIIVKRFLPTENFFVLTLLFVSCLLIAGVVTYILNRYMPFMFDLRKLKK